MSDEVVLHNPAQPPQGYIVVESDERVDVDFRRTFLTRSGALRYGREVIDSATLPSYHLRVIRLGRFKWRILAFQNYLKNLAEVEHGAV